MKIESITTLEEEWQIYISHVYKDGINPKSAQYIECRRAFMAGASAFLHEINILALLPDHVSVKCLEDLNQELIQFTKDVQNGKK